MVRRGDGRGRGGRRVRATRRPRSRLRLRLAVVPLRRDVVRRLLRGQEGIDVPVAHRRHRPQEAPQQQRPVPEQAGDLQVRAAGQISRPPRAVGGLKRTAGDGAPEPRGAAAQDPGLPAPDHAALDRGRPASGRSATDRSRPAAAREKDAEIRASPGGGEPSRAMQQQRQLGLSAASPSSSLGSPPVHLPDLPWCPGLDSRGGRSIIFSPFLTPFSHEKKRERVFFLFGVCEPARGWCEVYGG